MGEIDRFPNIYCPECEAIQKLELDVFEPREGQLHAAADIVCPDCGFIIATLHERPPMARG
jgi:ribosomal protein S27E